MPPGSFDRDLGAIIAFHRPVHLVKPPSDPFDVFLTRDPIVRRIVRQLRNWSKTAEDGLISGESGVGKSLLVRVLHMAASPSMSPLIECRSSEPLGVAHQWATLHERGGTVVLDTIESWPADDQAAFVRRLLERGPAQGRVQVLGTSRLSRSRLAREAWLHPALERRWSDHAVHVPPLRARPDDLAPLVELMLRRAGRASVTLSPEAWRALAAHGWPENVRELQQALGATLARRASERLDADDLQLDPLAPPALEAMADRTFDAVRREVDAWYLRRLIHQTGGNLSEASRRAGCSRKVLRDRLRRHGLYTAPRPSNPVGAPSVAREPAGAAIRWLDRLASSRPAVAREAVRQVWPLRRRGAA